MYRLCKFNLTGQQTTDGKLRESKLSSTDLKVLSTPAKHTTFETVIVGCVLSKYVVAWGRLTFRSTKTTFPLHTAILR